jgi:MarR family transcriptional regulator, organic hydroperoxide resistance regulator
MRILWALHHGLETGSRRMESTLGVTGQQRLVLRIIGRYPGITAGRLARVLHLHPSTVTGLLKRLDARDLLVRGSDERDARLASLRLSARGRRIDRTRSGTIESVMSRELVALGADRVATTRAVLHALAERLASWSDRLDRR